MLNNISITGITPLDYYPNKCSIKNCKQNIKSLKLCIPCKKPDIESIEEVKVNFCINEYKKLKTILGIKILVDISCTVKVIYTSLTDEQSLHSAHWNINFCDFILLENLYQDECDICKSNLFIGLEDVFVSCYDNRFIDLSLLYIICNNFNINDYECRPTKRDCRSKEKKIFTPNLERNKTNDCNNYYCQVDYYDSDEI